MVASLIHKVKNPADLDQLTSLVKGLIGQLCWGPRLSYGDELVLHLGARLPYGNKHLAHKQKGAWILGTLGTDWQIRNMTDKIATSGDAPDIIAEKIQIIANTTVAAIEIGYPQLSLTMTFSSGHMLTVSPESDDNMPDLPNWELFTPDHMILKIGPGAQWTYGRADETPNN